MDAMGKGGLTREQIFGAMDLKIEAVYVPEWGGTVYVRSLSGAGLDEFQGSRVRLNTQNKAELVYENTRAKLLSKTLCDEQGMLLFSDADVQKLGEKNAGALDRIYEVAQRMNGMRPDDLEQKVKNSEAVLTVNSSSVSLSP